MKASQDLIDFVEDLRNEALGVKATAREYASGHTFVDAGKLNGLIAGCRLLIAKLGSFGQVWDKMLQSPGGCSVKEFVCAARFFARQMESSKWDRTDLPVAARVRIGHFSPHEHSHSRTAR